MKIQSEVISPPTLNPLLFLLRDETLLADLKLCTRAALPLYYRL